MKNILKKIICKIRSFFKKEKKKEPSKTQLKYLAIASNFSNIGFTSKKEPGKNQKELFKKIQPGDLVFCKMPLTDKVLKNIPEGHRSRPYLIVQKTENEMYGYACFTHPKKLESYEKHVFVNRVYDEENHKYKDSCVQFDKAFIIPISHILNFYEELDEYTINQIARELQVYKNIRKKNILQFSKPISFLPGDIIQFNNTCYYLKEIQDSKYIVYPFNQDGEEVNSTLFKMNLPNHLDINHPMELENLSIDSLIRLSNATFNQQIRNLEKKPKIKVIIKKEYTYPHSIGEIFEHKITHEKIIYLFDYANLSYGLNYEGYLLKIYNFKQINLNVFLDTNEKVDEIDLEYAYKALIKQNNEHKAYFQKFLKIEKDEYPYSYKFDYEVGSILQESFGEAEYIYLYSIGKRMFGLSMGKKKKFMEIHCKQLTKIDDILEDKMIEYLKCALELQSGRIKSTLEKILDEYSPTFGQVNYELKYPSGTILKSVYNDNEYMYLFSMDRADFGIDLMDASEEIYDFSTIDLRALKEDGELVEEDTIYILDGILSDTIRYKLKTAIEAIKINF